MQENPNFAHICFPDGRELTVSITDLAPCPCETITIPESTTYYHEITDDKQPIITSDSSSFHNCQRHEHILLDTVDNSLPTLTTSPDYSTRPNCSDSAHSQPLVLRRSSRNTGPP